MTHTPDKDSRRRLVAWVGCFTVATLVAEATASAQLGIFKRNKGTTYQTFRDPAGRFVIEYPTKDWRVNQAKGSIVASFTQKNGEAAVAVEYSKLKLALTRDEIDDVVLKLEVDALKEKDPSVRDVNANIGQGPSGPRIVIRYTRNGTGGREHVEQYSVPVGDELYRVSCSARITAQARYQPILTYIAGSFSLLRTQS